MSIIDYISAPWPWYVSGPLIALCMFLLLYAGGEFGVSSNLRTFCSMAGAGKNNRFFDYDWKSQIWNVVFVLGSILGGYIAANYLSNPAPLALNPATIAELKDLHIYFDGELAPLSIFSWEGLQTTKGFIAIVSGGFLVGFGARYAGGCTSGHAISGLSNLQLPSLIAVIGFFIGGLIMTQILFPFIF